MVLVLVWRYAKRNRAEPEDELMYDETEAVPEEKRAALRGVLANDPRPRYQDDPARVYGLTFAGLNVRFRVENGTLTVKDVEKRER